MKLSCVLLSCDSNSHYLSFWPIVKKAWNELVGVPVKMVYIGTKKPYDDPDIMCFQPIAEWPTATQAQCIRLLYPALLKYSGAVMIGDIDCMPLNPNFFKKEFEKAKEEEFVSLRAPLQGTKEICMMYVGATPSVWGQVFGVKTEWDVREILRSWAWKFPASGEHGGKGWTTDQEILYDKVMNFPRKRIADWEWDIPRLDRSMPCEWQEITRGLMSRVYYGHYIDFHLPSLREQKTAESVMIILTVAINANNESKAVKGN